MHKHFPPINPSFPVMLHGGDYNPDQWLETPEILQEDMRLMQLAHCNAMSVGIFSWAALEPREGEFHFEWLDDVRDRLVKAGGRAVLATPSGAKPAWMAAKYPEIRRMREDGVRMPQHTRHNHCRTSPIYRQKVTEMNTRLAERYKDHPALLVWHISNEYNGGDCFCPLCWGAFIDWLKGRYNNDLDALNHAWWTGFWAHRFMCWEEITALDGSVHGMIIDWKRFKSDQTLDFMKVEIAPLKRITPDIPVTTNLMGTFKELNYWDFAKVMDVVSWDSYPAWHSSEDESGTACHVAFAHDLNRSLKEGKPFMLMESTPSATNWQSVGRPKRPGMHLLSALQAVAHGSDTVQYFQWRKSRGSSEKFHGAVVDHVGHENTRVFRDVTAVGEALEKLAPVVGASVAPKVALLFDWENWWAIDETQGPHNQAKNYCDTVHNHYRVFWERGIPVDIVNEESDLSGYSLVIAPMMYMVRKGVGESIQRFVEAGGTFVTTYWSGIADDSDLCFLGGFPGPLRPFLGIWAEETDVFHPSQAQRVIPASGNDLGLSGEYAARDYADVIHLEGAEALATYGDDFYAGSPALTRNRCGKGEAYYVASRNDISFLRDFFGSLTDRLGITPAVQTKLPEGVSATIRWNPKGTYRFLMNFNTNPVTLALSPEEGGTDLLSGEEISGSVTLPGFGVRVIAGKA
ncbi:MAG: beta-galactosidase [Planctomycetes bacterium]|nr:beta-galactosidase [Planctomycetota bacterium]